MKQLIIALALAVSLAACASNPGNEEIAAAVSEQAGPERKKVCNYERGTSTGRRLQKVCRWADAP